MSTPKMNTITDPLQNQKTAAANLGLQNYQTASANVPMLQQVANNLGQSQSQTLANQSPLFQGLYNDVNQDINGSGGPYSALTQNLLGAFDTQQNNTQQNLIQQLQAEGLGGSGAGMAVLGNEGVNAAQQRAGVVDQNQVNMLNMADQVAQQLAQQNQLQGYSNPMSAIGNILSLASPPSFQSPETTYYTPAGRFATTNMIGNTLGSYGEGWIPGASAGSGINSQQKGQQVNQGYNSSPGYYNSWNNAGYAPYDEDEEG